MNHKQKNYYPSAFVLYLNYFIHGIGASILAQQVIKDSLAVSWSTSDDKVVLVAAALGLGRLISLPFSGPLSDKMGRRISILIGIFSYAIFFIGIALANNFIVAYLFAILGGIANSFLDTGVIPQNLEILYPRSGLASMLTKFFMSFAQLLLPFMLMIFATKNLSYESFMVWLSVVSLILGIIIIKLPLPEKKNKISNNKSIMKSIRKTKFNKESICLILIGFTSTATFQLWLNTAQKFAVDIVNISDPSILQKYYSFGSIVAIVITSILVTKIKEVRFLIIYPLVSLITLVSVLISKSATVTIIGSFLIGFFAAGGVLQLATAAVNDIFDDIKGTITSIIMIFSSLSNYIMLSLAGSFSATYGIESVMILNIVNTLIGVILALIVNLNYKRN
ncbi:MAG: MFS transporter [Tissierellia bacterium]|nr:MFS transporter [Tissierellia bacterium]